MEPVLEMGPPLASRPTSPWSTNVIVVAVAMLVVGVAIGLVVGRSNASRSSGSILVAASPTSDLRGYVVWGNASCANLSGTELWVGTNITNYSNKPITLMFATVTAAAGHFHTEIDKLE